MKVLEEMILKEGQVLPGDVLKVGSFLNHQMDPDLMREMGREIARLFEGCGVTKVLTVEASGIALAISAAMELHVPMVFGKKHRTSNVSGETYTAPVHSYTHNTDYEVAVPKAYLPAGDRVLIVDDFLASGEAVNCLLSLIRQAGAVPVGAAIAVEKGFQPGGAALRASGLRVESLAIVESMEDGHIVFRH